MFHEVYVDHERWHAPRRTYERALSSGLYEDVRAAKSLRVLRRVGG
ncbi:hypothetical protein [Streptomyces sp. S186]